jgi:arabinogalactan oligomer / maltooligosaccharide transport system permease protein
MSDARNLGVVEAVEKGDLIPGPPTGGAFIGPSGTHRSRKQWFTDVGWRYVVTLFALFFALFPIAWAASAAFSTGGLSNQTLIPEEPTLDNFRTLMSDPGHPPFWTWFRNSMVVSTVTAAWTVFLAALAAYAFSRLRFRGRRGGLLFLLLIQMFPNLLASTALFLFMTDMKSVFPTIGLGSIWGLILIYLGGALGMNAWLMKGFFDTVPKELDESAKVDGATHAETFFRIILPLAVPILAVIALLSFITSQAEYLLASVILSADEDSKTLAVGLSGYVQAGFDSRFGPFAAGSLIGAIPSVIIFLFMQRYIVSGLTSGAVKG